MIGLCIVVAATAAVCGLWVTERYDVELAIFMIVVLALVLAWQSVPQ